VRFGKAPQRHVHRENREFTIGKAAQIQEGKHLTFIACGETVSIALAAAEQLKTEEISCRVLSMHTIKPLDEEAVIRAAKETGAIITVEEHSVYGGLGEACAGAILQSGISLPFKIIGFPDEYMVTGSQMDIFNHYGISTNGLVETARRLLGIKEQ
jgi:transketolase